MFVYRVEMRASFFKPIAGGDRSCYQNIGPYRGYITHIPNGYLEHHGFNDKFEIDYREDIHPIPRDDRRLVRRLDRLGISCDYIDVNGYYFGFTSKQKLARWFRKYDRENLHNAGYVCTVYECNSSDTVAGNKQALFKLKKAEPLYVIPLTEIY